MPTYPFPTPIPHIPGAYMVRITGRDGLGIAIQNDLGFSFYGLGDPPLAADIADAVGTHWATLVNAVLHHSYVGETVGVYDLGLTESVEVIRPMVAPGGKVGDPTSPGVAMVIKHTTTVRRKRGITFMGPLSTSQLGPDAGTVSDDALPVFQAAWDAFVTGFTTDPIWSDQPVELVVISKITNKLWDPRAILVSSSILEKNLGSLRGRRVRG